MTKSREFELLKCALEDYVKRIKHGWNAIEFVAQDLEILTKDAESGKISETEVKDIIYLIFVYFGLIARATLP